MVPLLDDQANVGSPAGLAAANLAAITWCTEVNAAVHSQIVAVPTERLLAEAPLLGALPSLRASIGPAPVVRKVDKLSCVRFASGRYSVPTTLIGTHVHLVHHGGRLQVLIPATGLIVADHELVVPRADIGPGRPLRRPPPGTLAQGPAPVRGRAGVLRAR